jgi:hypothetical protein
MLHILWELIKQILFFFAELIKQILLPSWDKWGQHLIFLGESAAAALYQLYQAESYAFTLNSTQ